MAGYCYYHYHRYHYKIITFFTSIIISFTTSISVFVCVCVSIHVRVSLYVRVCRCVYMYVYACVRVSLYACVCLCVHVAQHTDTFTWIHLPMTPSPIVRLLRSRPICGLDASRNLFRLSGSSLPLIFGIFAFGMVIQEISR